MSSSIQQYSDLNLHKLLFIDIETVSSHPSWESMTHEVQELWSIKSIQLQRYMDIKVDDATLYRDKAGIYAEFGKIVCISVGYIQSKEDEDLTISVKSIYDDNETKIIQSFYQILERLEKKNRSITFVGHNIKEFDLPYICRRSLINGIPLPKPLQLNGMKPWEIPHIDTLELWRFGDYKHYISLRLLASILGIPSPKDDIDGSMVSRVYWQDNEIKAIANYCNKDVVTVAKIYLKLKSIDWDLKIAYR